MGCRVWGVGCGVQGCACYCCCSRRARRESKGADRGHAGRNGGVRFATCVRDSQPVQPAGGGQGCACCCCCTRRARHLRAGPLPSENVNVLKDVLKDVNVLKVTRKCFKGFYLKAKARICLIGAIFCHITCCCCCSRRARRESNPDPPDPPPGPPSLGLGFGVYES